MQRSFWSNWFKPATGSSRSWTLEELGELYEVLLRNGEAPVLFCCLSLITQMWLCWCVVSSFAGCDQHGQTCSTQANSQLHDNNAVGLDRWGGVVGVEQCEVPSAIAAQQPPNRYPQLYTSMTQCPDQQLVPTCRCCHRAQPCDSGGDNPHHRRWDPDG